jgi:signal transduction histidine kinase/ActR/RegA family two-component response regulator
LLIAGEQVGMFDVEHETALFAAASIVCFTALTWWTASATLRVDVARRAALDTLRGAETQLRQSQKMEAVSRLAGGIAHDFNNILTVIISYGYILQRSARPGDPKAADLAELVRAAHRAAELTRQLLAFSRRQVMQPSVVDLDAAIDAMTNMLRRAIAEDVQLDIVPGGPLDPVHVDPGQLEQVILNLVINARDAMPQGGRITIATTNIEVDGAFAAAHPPMRAGAYVRMSVRDTGVGMDDATIAQVFEPFFTTKEAGKGTGLGLPTALGIVEQSGGHIVVESAPGRGTAFDVYLPRHTERAGATTVKPVAATASTGNETVLLVEDDDQVRALIGSILRTHGYVVLEAATPGDALLIAEQHEHAIDLLLTDVVMPRMSGRQLSERLSPRRPAMRVLFISGHTDDAILLYGVESSAFAFIQKPLTPDGLLAKLRQVLDSRAD